MIIENGTIRTGDERLPVTRALAIAGGLVAGGVDVREGDRSSVSPDRIDLDGRCVVPGFTDAHVHFADWSRSLRQLDLTGAASRAQALDLVRAALSEGDGWLIGHGWRSHAWPDGGELDRAALDPIARGRPCALFAHDHHTLAVSTAAFEAIGQPDGEIVARDASGTATGLLREHAAWRFAARIPMPAADELDEMVREGVRAAHRRGVTGVHDFQRDHGLACWQRLHGDRQLGLRVWASLPVESLDEALSLQLRSGFGDDWLRIGPVKAFADGTLGSRTASMLEPFADGGLGIVLLDAEGLGDLAARAAGGGLEIAVHAIGDAANRSVLDALERTRPLWSAAALRPRIEHAQLLHPDDIARFSRLGVTASVQPSHAPSDRSVAEAAWGERCAGAYAYGSLASSGAALCFGSDAPIEPLDPLAGMQAAVTRDWPAGEAVTAEVALAGFTTGPARARHAERSLGRLLPGCAADLCVLDRDPLTCPADEIGAIEVVATMVDGRWVHGRPPW